MALKACKECSAQISNTAKSCPQCGAKQSNQVGFITATIVVLGVFFILKAGLEPPHASTPATTPERSAEAIRKDRENTVVLLAVKSLKASMKKPESFELVNATMIEGRTLCLQYKARNSWNDLRPGTQVITDTINSSDTRAWNDHCAGKSGDDYTAVRAVLR